MRLDAERHGLVGRLQDVAHHRLPAGRGRCHAEIGSVAVEPGLVVEQGARLEHHAAARGGVVVAPPQGVEQPGAGEVAGEQARQPAIGAEQRGAGMAGAMAALVAVRVGEDADAIALLQRIPDQPFEGAPVGMNLDRAFDPRVMRHLDVGVAPADMGEHDAILVPQRLEEGLGAVGVAPDVGLIVDQGVRRTMDLPALVHEHHVAVTAQAGVARPFVAREDDETAVLVVLTGELVQLVPERRGDLEVVALVAHAVEEGLVARELDQLARRIGADRLLRLAVQIAPIGTERRVRREAERIAPAEHAALRIEHVDEQVTRLRHRQALDRQGGLAAPHREGRG